jgi:hypothetical protein
MRVEVRAATGLTHLVQALQEDGGLLQRHFDAEQRQELQSALVEGVSSSVSFSFGKVTCLGGTMGNAGTSVEINASEENDDGDWRVRETTVVPNSANPKYSYITEQPVMITPTLVETLLQEELLFHLWHHPKERRQGIVVKNESQNESTSILLGVCAVPLGDLLISSRGVRGWFALNMLPNDNSDTSVDAEEVYQLRTVAGLEVAVYFNHYTELPSPLFDSPLIDKEIDSLIKKGGKVAGEDTFDAPPQVVRMQTTTDFWNKIKKESDFNTEEVAQVQDRVQGMVSPASLCESRISGLDESATASNSSITICIEQIAHLRDAYQNSVPGNSSEIYVAYSWGQAVVVSPRYAHMYAWIVILLSRSRRLSVSPTLVLQ